MGIKLSDFISDDFEFTDEDIYNTYIQAGFDVKLNPEFEYLQNPFTSKVLNPIVIEVVCDDEMQILTNKEMDSINTNSKDIIRMLTKKEAKLTKDNVYNTRTKSLNFNTEKKNNYNEAA